MGIIHTWLWSGYDGYLTVGNNLKLYVNSLNI